MMLGSPFFSDFDDGYYYHRPRSYYEQQRRRAAEEARRRAELERYYRLKELEEQEQLRRRQEYARRLRQQQLMEEQEAYEKELRRRRAAQEEAERKERLRALRYLRGDYSDDDEDELDDVFEEAVEEPVYRLMRGPDGRIYRVQVGTSTTRKPSAARTPSVDEHMEEEKVLPKPNVSKKVPIRTSSSTSHTTNAMEIEERNPVQAGTTAKNDGKNKKKAKKRVTIIVEDASDSETDDEYKSPWRNRRPSPGEWMEPVESFDDHMHIR